MRKLSSQDALDYHSRGRKGKIEVVPTKPTATQHGTAIISGAALLDALEIAGKELGGARA